jgi:hypothetical protein
MAARGRVLGPRTLCPPWNRNPQARRLISVHLLPRATRPRLLLNAAVALLVIADGMLQQLPWKGLIHRPNQANIIEPSIAW